MQQCAIYAAGCFWGVEALFSTLPGVLQTEVGYTGGQLENPTYEAVCRERTGHLEAIKIIYDDTVIDYYSLTNFFFEIHDPTQADGQGPDIGDQYLSAIFYANADEKCIAEKLIKILKDKGYAVKTVLLPQSAFWPAEAYHQQYYQKTGKKPYCHFYQKKF